MEDYIHKKEIRQYMLWEMILVGGTIASLTIWGIERIYPNEALNLLAFLILLTTPITGIAKGIIAAKIYTKKGEEKCQKHITISN